MKSFTSFIAVFLILLFGQVLTLDIVEHPKGTSFWKPNCSKDDVECWKKEFRAKIKC